MSRLFKSLLVAGFMAGLATSAQAETVARVTGHHTVMVGEVRITALYKGFVTDNARLEPVAYAYKRLTTDGAADRVLSSPAIAAFVVDTGDRVTLVCVDGTEPTPAVRGYLMSSLVAAGYSPDDIDEIRSVDSASSM